MDAQKNTRTLFRDYADCLQFCRDELQPRRLFTISRRWDAGLVLGTACLVASAIVNAYPPTCRIIWPAVSLGILSVVFLHVSVGTRLKIPLTRIGLAEAVRLKQCERLREFLIRRGYSRSEDLLRLHAIAKESAEGVFQEPNWPTMVVIGSISGALPGLIADFFSAHSRPETPKTLIGALSIVLVCFVWSLWAMMNVFAKDKDKKVLKELVWELLSDYALPDDLVEVRASSRT